MIRYARLAHEFVHHIPARLEPGILYVSMEFATANHLCCCGCGIEVVTPIKPTDWKLTFDGETVSLWPSIGNWQFPCRSHYVIERGGVREAPQWTADEIAEGRRNDRSRKAQYYCSSQNEKVEAATTTSRAQAKPSLLARIRQWLTGRAR